MEVDSQPVFCQRTALRGGDVGIGHHVQAIGDFKHRYRPLHELAVSTMGH